MESELLKCVGAIVALFVSGLTLGSAINVKESEWRRTGVVLSMGLGCIGAVFVAELAFL